MTSHNDPSFMSASSASYIGVLSEDNTLVLSVAPAKDTHINDMPDEVILEIFSYMSVCENINILQKVCTRWKILAQDRHLWYEKEYMIRVNTTEEEAIETFKAAPELRTVIMEYEVQPTIFDALSENCHNLTTLVTYFHQMLNYTEVKNLVDGCKQIQILRISELGLLADTRFFDVLTQLSQLRVLQLKQYCNAGCQIPLAVLADRCPHLFELDMGWLRYQLQDAEYFINAKKHMLRHLCIKWTSVERRCIVPLLPACADTLEHLQLNTYDVVDERDVEGLGELRNLKELIFETVHKQVPRIIPMIFKSGALSKLQVICLRHMSDMGDETMIAISKGCPRLQELSLIACGGHTDAAFKLLYKLKHLETLKISYCDCLRGDAIRYISKLPALHTLHFDAIRFKKLEPGVEYFLNMSGLRRLYLSDSICWSIPFGRFPGRLINLRELHINYCDGNENDLTGLRLQMPELQVKGYLGALFTDSE